MSNIQLSHDIEAGKAIYSRLVLSIYDLYVLGLSNHLIWNCPTRLLLDNYDAHVSTNHLDVGVGTGYFLDKCCFSIRHPSITLLDLNANSLAVTAKRLKRYQPETYQHNVFEPLTLKKRFDSIGMNYLLHCLPGDMEDKAVVFHNLSEVLNPGGVLFGSTLVNDEGTQNWAARRLMDIYNNKGIFTNRNDTTHDLEVILADRFSKYSLKTVGNAAIFSAIK